MILRLPKIITHTRDAYGPLGERLVAAFAEHGMLTIEQCVQVAASNISKESKELPIYKQKARIMLTTRLIKEHLIVQVPSRSLALSPTKLRENYIPSTTTSKDLIVEPRIKNWKLSDPEIYKSDLSAKLVLGCDYVDHLYSKHHNQAVVLIRPKAKETNRSLLWRINYILYTIRFQDEECTRVLRNYCGKAGGLLFWVVFHFSRKMTKKLQDRPLTSNKDLDYWSRTIQLIDLISVVERFVGGHGKGENVEYGIMALLGKITVADEKLKTITTGQSREESLTVNLGKIRKFIHYQYLEKVVKQRFGCRARRILNYLNSTGPQEERRIIEVCMVDAKETRQLLCLLLKAGFVQSVKDNIPANAGFLWDFDFDIAKDQIFMSLYQTATNLVLWAQHQLSMRIPKFTGRVIDIIEDVYCGEQPGAKFVLMQHSIVKMIQNLEKMRDAVFGSLIAIDESIALICDF
jgi:hypothetical protein